MKEKFLLFIIFILINHSFNSQTVIPPSDEIILPQFAVGGNTLESRLQYVCRLRLIGLNPNSVYRYVSGASTNQALSISTLSKGDFFVINNASGTAGYITGYSAAKSINGSLMGNNEFITTTTSNYRYGEFTSDASGSYTGWFCMVPNASGDFGMGSFVYFYVQVNNGAGGTIVAKNYRTTNTILILDYTYTGSPNQADAVIGKSFANDEEIIVLYDNILGTGRPLYATFTENDGITTNFITWYKKTNGVDAYKGRWGAIIHDTLSNGIRRIERRDIPNNLFLDLSTSPNGIWGSTNTVNTTNGSTPIYIDSIVSPLPVNMAYFNSTVHKNNVTLNWSTFQERNNSGFEIERSENGIEWTEVSFVIGKGTTEVQQFYSYYDANLKSSIYKYRLKQIDYNGNPELYALDNDVVIGKPDMFTVTQNYPNPSNPSSKIDYQIPISGHVQIKIYDSQGKLITTVIDKYIEEGYYSATLDCNMLTSGIYFYRITEISANKIFSRTMKMVVIK